MEVLEICRSSGDLVLQNCRDVRGGTFEDLSRIESYSIADLFLEPNCTAIEAHEMVINVQKYTVALCSSNHGHISSKWYVHISGKWFTCVSAPIYTLFEMQDTIIGLYFISDRE